MLFIRRFSEKEFTSQHEGNGGTVYFVPDPSGTDGRGLRKSEYGLRKASELVRSGSGVFEWMVLLSLVKRKRPSLHSLLVIHASE